MKHVWLLPAAVIVTGAHGDRACYVGKDLEFRAPPFIVPCTNDTQSSCCMLGDKCLSGNVCYSIDAGIYYQYGCTDVSYGDATCPYKCGSDPAKSPWTALQFCGNDTWACNDPASCGCEWPGNLGLVNITGRQCQDMGSQAIVALQAPSTLLPLLLLPETAGLATSYFSPVVNGSQTIWPATPQANYTPEIIAYPTSYGSQPASKIALYPEAIPASTTFSVHDISGSSIYWGQDITVTGAGTTSSTSRGSTEPTASTAASPTGASPSSSSTGVLVGISIGTLVLCIAAALIIWLGIKKTRTAKSSSQSVIWTRTRRQAANLSRKRAWFVPATMLAAVAAGIAFAVGHHEYNLNLVRQGFSNRITRRFGLEVTDQQFHSAVGTGFGFLVKSCLTLAISTAYAQAFWFAVKHSKLRDLSMIDAGYSALRDALTLGNIPMWLRCPIILCLALLTWLMPLVAIVSSATLTVEFQQVLPKPTNSMNVSNLDFRSFAFSATIAGVQDVSSTGYQFTYDGPSLAVQRIAGAVAMQGAILPIPAPGVNTTWTVNFEGPALSCEYLNADDKRATEWAVANLTFSDPACFTPTVFYSWFQNDSTALVDYNYYNQTYNETVSDGASIADDNNLAQNFTLDASFYLATIPSLMQPSLKAPWNPAACEYVGQDRSQWQTPLETKGDTTNVLNCTLRKASYTIDFGLLNGIQSVKVSITDLQDVQSPLGLGHFGGEAISDDTLQALSFQSIFQAFAMLLQGDIRSGLSEQTPLLVNTSILSTLLAQTPELAYLTPQKADLTMSSVYRTNLQQVLAQLPGTKYDGLAPATVPSPGLSLPDMIVELFNNITVSLMSSPELQPDSASRTFPAAVPVSTDAFQNVYVYSADKLWLAYGLAIGLTIVAVICGLVCIYLNHACYSTDFSTILRASEGATLNVEVERDDDGRYPLPQALSKATLLFAELKHKGTRTMEVESDSEPKHPTVTAALLDNNDTTASGRDNSLHRKSIDRR